MDKNIEAPYPFITRAFEVDGKSYNVSITPELISSNGELEPTSKYIGILIDPDYGTIQFDLSINDNAEWVPVQQGIIPPRIAYEIGKIIEAKSE